MKIPDCCIDCKEENTDICNDDCEKLLEYYSPTRQKELTYLFNLKMRQLERLVSEITEIRKELDSYLNNEMGR